MIAALIALGLLSGAEAGADVALPADMPVGAVIYERSDLKAIGRAAREKGRGYSKPSAGEVVIYCQIEPDGTIPRCAVIYENPQGQGLGEATVEGFMKSAKATQKPSQTQWKKFRFLWSEQAGN